MRSGAGSCLTIIIFSLAVLPSIPSTSSTVANMGMAVEEIYIMTRPQSFVRELHSNITLPCVTHHTGGTVVTWSKDSQVLSADNVKVLMDQRLLVHHQPRHGVNISISNLRGSDSGRYRCTLNFNKKALHVEHKLLVEVAPSIHVLQPANKIIVKAGSFVQLECQAHGHPPPQITWYREHNQPFTSGTGQISEDGNTTDVTVATPVLRIGGSNLVLKKIGRLDAGDYICKASNGVGHGSVRETVKVEVLHAPEVFVDVDWVHAGEGEAAVLTCRVLANPGPKVLWYKETMKLIDGSHLRLLHVGDTYKLSITGVDSTDWGTYHCQASNSLGDTSKSLTLTGAPGIPVVLDSLGTPHSYSYDLVWEVMSSYLPLIHEILYWEYNKTPSANSSAAASSPPRDSFKLQVHSDQTQFSYSLNGLHPETEYMVCVKSYNKWGWSEISEIHSFKTLIAVTETIQEIVIQDNSSKSSPDLNYNGPDPLLLQPEVSKCCDMFSISQNYLLFLPCDSFILLFLSLMFLF